MKIFGWLADESGCGHYRVKMPLDELGRRGHEVQYSQRMGRWGREEAEIVIAQRTTNEGPCKILADMKAEGRARIVLEIDDDLLGVQARDNQTAKFWNKPEIQKRLTTNARLAHMITVSTAPLGEVMGHFNPNVRVLENCIDEQLLRIPLPLRRGRPDGLTVLGWQGSATHTNDWRLIQPYVAEVMAANEGVRMRFLGSWFEDGLPRDRIDVAMWTQDLNLHYKRVTKFDVGLAPLTASRFNASKSGIRALEYMALGVPGIFSAVPAYTGVVEHGVTGFLARTAQEWRGPLQALVDDPTARVEMGDAARRAAAAWTIQARAHLWEAAFQSLL